MKFKLIFLLLTLFSATCFAQDNSKVVIGIIPFNYTEVIFKKQAEQVQDIVTRVFSSMSNRISLLDRSKTAVIMKELEIQKGKEYTGGKTVKQNKAYGAQFVIIGTITHVEVEKTKFSGLNPFNKDKQSTATTHKYKIGFTLQKVDVTTGEVNATRLFDMGTTGSFETEEYKKDSDPVKSVVRVNSVKITNEVTNWLIKLFPTSLKFYKIEERDKKGVPKFVSLIMDNNSNIMIGEQISIYLIEDFEFEGKMKRRRTETTIVKVKEIQGDVVKCAVISGEKLLDDIVNEKKKIEIYPKE